MTPIRPLKAVDKFIASRRIPQGVKLVVLTSLSDRPGERVFDFHSFCCLWATYDIPLDADRSATAYWVGCGKRRQIPQLNNFLRPIVDDDDGGSTRC